MDADRTTDIMCARVYLSVCSGIEAATVAWRPLGWHAWAYSEIDRFPSAVLAHHYPDTPNLGDMTKYQEWPDADIDLLVGGTPCQSFSVAGLRKGLDDPRGNLMLTFGAIAGRYRPRWLVWENVPGVLSSNGGRDFGTLLGMLAELGYGFAFRILDAQYFGVAQRRRRVFVVGHLGDWRRAAAVLFERASLSGNPSPRREPRQNVAGTLSARTQGGGGLGTDFELGGGIVMQSCAPTLSADYGDKMGLNDQHIYNQKGGLFVFGWQNGAHQSPSVSDAIAPTLDKSKAPAIAIQERASAGNGCGPGGAGFRTDDCAYTLESRNTPQAVAFDLRGRDGGAMPEGPHETANIRAASGGSSRSYIAQPTAVRRLTPVECERLQGFPDCYTDVRERTPDGPRYRALGNSMAVPCMRWIGQRIDEVDFIVAEREAA